MLNTSRFRRDNKDQKERHIIIEKAEETAEDRAALRQAYKQKAEKRGRRRHDPFAKWGGKIAKRRMDRRIDKMPLSRVQKEYVKQVMAKHDVHGSRGITKAEFEKGLKEMEQNVKDPIKKKEIKEIKKHF